MPIRIIAKLRRILGVEVACIELETLVKRLCGGISLECHEDAAVLSVKEDYVGCALRALDRASLVNWFSMDGSKHRPSTPRTIEGLVKSPAPHLNPVHALLMVNLSGALKGPLVDPFSGLGTIPSVAGALGIYSVGCDLARPGDVICDALRLPLRHGSVEAIVTDPPFNRDFRTSLRLRDLYIGFIDAAYETLIHGGRLVTMAPSYLLEIVVDEAMALGMEPRCIAVDHVHGALSRYILCFEKVGG